MTQDLILDIITSSPEETESIGKQLAKMLLSDAELAPYIAMYGDLGVGKTAFVRGVASVIAPGCAVRSPTFAIVNEYRSRDTQVPLYHFDMYRITSDDDLYSCGYDDYLDAGYCIVEWSENIPYALPEEHLRVTIEKLADGEMIRRIRIYHIKNFGGCVC